MGQLVEEKIRENAGVVFISPEKIQSVVADRTNLPKVFCFSNSRLDDTKQRFPRWCRSFTEWFFMTAITPQLLAARTGTVLAEGGTGEEVLLSRLPSELNSHADGVFRDSALHLNELRFRHRKSTRGSERECSSQWREDGPGPAHQPVNLELAPEQSWLHWHTPQQSPSPHRLLARI